MKCDSCGHENIPDARFCASCGIPLAQQSDGGWIGRLVGGRFRVTRVLGEGGMGVVYAAEQQMGSTVRRAAIKTLHPHLSKDPSVLARFHRECGTVAQLEHPNTIKVFDFGSEEDGTLYIAMEFVEGESLDRIIDREGPLAPARVVDILEQVCGALDEAHDQGIVHRDLKPENVVLGEKLGRADFVKVLDFGIAARSESSDAAREQKLTQQGMVLGTPPYMSPEQFTGVELDRRSDIYSLGVMAYEMLTGTLPFTATTPWQWATEHMTAQPHPIEQRPSGVGVPATMRDAVMQALAKDPSERPDTAGAFVRNLKTGLSSVESLQLAPTQAMQAVAGARGGAPKGGPALEGAVPGGIAPAVDAGVATGVMPAQAALTGGTAPLVAAAADSAAGPTGTQTEMAATALPTKKSPGLVIALVGVLAVGGAAAAFALGGGGGKEAPAEPDDEAAAAAQAEVSSVPEVSEPKSPGSDGTASQGTPPGPNPSAPVNAPAAGPKTSPAPAPSPAPSPSPSVASAPSPSPQPSPTAKPAADCSSCGDLVRSGSWSRAAQMYGSCPGADQRQCNAVARQELRSQVKTALSSGNCARARSIASSSSQLGVPTPGSLAKAIKDCK